MVTEVWGFVSRDQQSSNVVTMATRQGATGGLVAGWLMTLSYPGWSREIPLLLTLKSEETWFGKRWKYDKCLCTHLCVRVWARAREREMRVLARMCVHQSKHVLHKSVLYVPLLHPLLHHFELYQIFMMFSTWGQSAIFTGQVNKHCRTMATC